MDSQSIRAISEINGTTTSRESVILLVDATLNVPNGGFVNRNFSIIGTAGYIAPRHLKAIKDTGSNLLAAFDVNDSVGILDKYFPNVPFFTKFEQFHSYSSELNRANPNTGIEYVAICSPNYLHCSHIQHALRIGANAICEKPLIINPDEFEILSTIQNETGREIKTILQLRVHKTIQSLRTRILLEPTSRRHQVNLIYVTPRGPWYFSSWKGDISKSGGIAMNIGIHFFDMLLWVFGPVHELCVHSRDEKRISGKLELERASVQWSLSIDRNDNPHKSSSGGFRLLALDGEEIDFTDGFTELHTQVYKEIFTGGGFGLEDARPAVMLAHQISSADPGKSISIK